MWIEFLSLWSERRRAQYLLREEVQRVLSIDDGVWPSVFSDQAIGGGMLPIHIGGPKIPDWVGIDSPLWEDLGALQSFIADNDSTLIRPFWVVAYSGLGGSIDTRVSDEWTLLGYDVADGIAISGLSNCGYTEQERVDVRSRGWDLDLNEYHLFSTFSTANEFREYSNTRVGEHAPFSVIGIHLIDTF